MDFQQDLGRPSGHTFKPSPIRTPPARDYRVDILDYQATLFGAEDRIALRHTAVNTIRACLTPYISTGHIIWVQDGPKPRLLTICGQDTVDQTTPFVQWLCRHLKRWQRTTRFKTAFKAELPLQPEKDGFTCPFTHIAFIPFDPVSRAANGGLLFTRDTSFSDAEQRILTDLTRQTALIAAAKSPKNPPRLQGRGRIIFWSIIASLMAIGCLPVRTTALAPAEVIPHKPAFISPMMNGVIEHIYVRPGDRVKAGQMLFRLDDTEWRNAVILAERALHVAEARLRQANLAAFQDDPAKQTLSITQAERDLALAKLNAARDQLERSVLRAGRDGIALFTSVQDWDGQPVRAGDAVMRIANPRSLRLRIDTPLVHGNALKQGALVRFFPDSNPLQAAESSIVQIDFEPTQITDGKTAYRAEADFNTSQSNDAQAPRIGTRGVAKIYGPRAPLAYVLIRRPLTLIRQWTGL